MEDKADSIFEETVFAVTCLVFGDEAGSQAMWQRIVRAALQHKQLDQRIKEIVDG